MLKDFKSPSARFYQSFCQSLNKYTPFTHPSLCGSKGFSVLKVRHCSTAGQELMQLMELMVGVWIWDSRSFAQVRLALPTTLEEDEDRLDLLWGFTVSHFMVMKANPQPVSLWDVPRCCPRAGPAEQVAESTLLLILSLPVPASLALQRALPLLHS